MEHELRINLLRCAAAYAEARRVSLSTLGRLAAGDWRFFTHLDDNSKTFTARKYDETIRWFAKNWPEDHPWPEELVRPTSEPERAA